MKNGQVLKDWTIINDAPIMAISELIRISATRKSKNRTWALSGVTTGAFNLNFDCHGIQWHAIFLHWEQGNKYESFAMVILPKNRITEWQFFLDFLEENNTPKPGMKKVYIFGSGYNDSFVPTDRLEDVILPGTLKAEIVSNVDGFFESGVALYHEMKAPAFRKYMLYGAPGNGKSMLVRALAADQLRKKRVVVLVASSDKYGPDFSKIQSALEVARENKFPVLLIVEEIDAYVQDPAIRARVLDALCGSETPDNSKGSILIMTSNHPEALDDAFLRLGRTDRSWEIPNIDCPATADALLKLYLGDMYKAEDAIEVTKKMVGKPRVFGRELAFTVRVMAASGGKSLTEAFQELNDLLTTSAAFERLVQSRTDRPFGYAHLANKDDGEIPF